MTAWAGRAAVRVAGPDAEAFLQGQLSQDIAALTVGRSAWSFVLEPQGKVDAFVRVRRVGEEEFVLDTDEGWGERLVTRLSRFKLRTKADIELVDGAEVPAPAADDWPGLVPGDERARIEAGFPKMGAEADETTIPNELGAHVIVRSVSFTKGCYTGQELVARVDSRGGNTPRQLRTVRSDAAVPAGAALFAGDKEVGRITSAAPASATEAEAATEARGDGSQGIVGLALVARSVEVPATVEARWDGGRADVEVVPLGGG